MEAKFNFEYNRPAIVQELTEAEQQALTAYDIDMPDDPAWLGDTMQKTIALMQDSKADIIKSCKDATLLDTKDLTPEAIERQRQDLVKPVRSLQLRRIQETIERDQENIARLESKALAYTQFVYSQDPAERVSQSFELKEIRDYLRTIPKFEDRQKVIRDALEKGDFRFAEASQNPLPLILPTWLEETRKEIAYKQCPALLAATRDAHIIASFRRKWLAHNNAETVSTMQSYGFDEDVIPIDSYFQAFPVPETSRRERLRNQWKKRQDDIKQRVKIFKEAVKQGKVQTPQTAKQGV